jgi:hypothetical protein
MFRAFTLAALVLAVLAYVRPSQAQWSEPLQPGDAEKATRRANLTAGVAGGLHFGSARGFPNEAEKLNDPAFEQSTGFAAGPNLALWLGGALTDYLNFGLGLAVGGLSGNGRSAQYSAFVVRIESFPLLSLGGAYSDLGVATAFGAGGSAIKQGDDTEAEGGAISVINLGLFHETLRSRAFRLGPSIDFTHLFSQSWSSAAVTAGLRLAIYDGP